MLRTRVITAIVLLLILVPVTVFGSASAFGALIGFVLVIAAWEWARLLRLGAAASIGYALVAGAVLVASNLDMGLSPFGFYRAAALFWIIAVPFAFLRRPTLASGAWRVFLLIAGVVIFVACWHALYIARFYGVAFVLSLLLVVWLADIGAYFAGRAFGRHKLAVTISPGKTWEGALGGWVLVLVVAIAAIVSGAFAPTLFTVYALSFGLPRALVAITVLVVISVFGDLFESLMKRQAGVKDSSHLLPGHGGVLDRVDALLPTLPLAMLLLHALHP